MAAEGRAGREIDAERGVIVATASSYTIRTVQAAMCVGTTLRASWFRGHCQEYGNLTPCVYRPHLQTNEGRNIEYWAGERFRQRAQSCIPEVPARDEHLRWLMLMQHHSCPTRLLDWTDSIFVALHFATQPPYDSAGEIWCINPGALNERSNHHICSPDELPIRYLAAQVFLGPEEIEELEAQFEYRFGRQPPRAPMAFIPPMEFPRLAAQASRFTIHPKPEAGNTITDLLKSRLDLVRYTVPADSKLTISRDLSTLGITPEFLFRSLEALSETILEEIVEEDYEKPEPPRFD